MTRQLAPHGTTARARGTCGIPKSHPQYRPPCPCDLCRSTVAAYRKAWRLDRHRGKKRLISTERARLHLLRLREDGLGWPQLQDATGCGYDTIRNILNGGRTEIQQSTEDKILAARPTKDNRARGLYIDAAGTRRRVHALQAIGHSARVIAAEAGVSWRCVEAISLRERDQVRQWIADAVAAAYGRLSMVQGASSKSRFLASKNGWAGPLQWNDEALDDPNGFPDWTGHCGTTSGWALHLAAGEDVCPPCEAARPSFEGRRRTQAVVQDCSPALDALTADGWAWHQIGRLFQVRDSHLRTVYMQQKETMGVAA